MYQYGSGEERDRSVEVMKISRSAIGPFSLPLPLLLEKRFLRRFVVKFYAYVRKDKLKIENKTEDR